MEQNLNQETSYDFRTARKRFSRIGLALVAFFAAAYASLYLIQFILIYFFKMESYSALTAIILSCICMYGIGMPVFRLCLGKAKSDPPTKGRISPATICILFLIAYSMMYIGNILGTVGTAVLERLTGTTFTATTIDLIEEMPLYAVLGFAVLLGPLVEELMFRKLILDRAYAYGEKISIVFSALLFAFFHMSIQQFFYAFLIGLVLGYLYVRTRSLGACWLLHALLNFFGSFVPLLLIENTCYEELLYVETTEEQMALFTEHPIEIGIIMLYSFLVLGLVIAGAICCALYVKRLRFAKTELQIPSGEEASVSLVNVGVIVCIAICSIIPFLDAVVANMA